MAQINLPIIDTCEGCGGLCCRTQESPPGYLYILLNKPGPGEPGIIEADRERVAKLPGKIKAELYRYGEYIKKHKKHPNKLICIWLNEATGQCRHHDLRPQVCRDFERGGHYCRQWRREFKIDQEPDLKIASEERLGQYNQIRGLLTFERIQVKSCSDTVSGDGLMFKISDGKHWIDVTIVNELLLQPEVSAKFMAKFLANNAEMVRNAAIGEADVI